MSPPKLKSKAMASMPVMDEPDRLPRITLEESDLPEIKDWKVGGKYQLLITVEQMSHGKKEYGDKKGDLESSFKVTKVEAYKTKEPVK